MVGPVIDLSYSCWYDFRRGRLLEWLAWMCWERRLLALAAEPPCTTFSPAAHPAVRSYREPLGYSWACSLPKVRFGTELAFRCLLLLLIMSLRGGSALLEQPRLSKMAWLTLWRQILAKEDCSEAWTASCGWGPTLEGDWT